MHEVIPGAIDASTEKPVPVYSVKDGIVHVNVGSILHPMNEDHQWNGFPFKRSSEISARSCARPVSRPSALPFAMEARVKLYTLIAICTAFG